MKSFITVNQGFGRGKYGNRADLCLHSTVFSIESGSLRCSILVINEIFISCKRIMIDCARGLKLEKQTGKCLRKTMLN